MKSLDKYINIRNLFFSEIKEVPGVISVGLSKKNEAPVLIVAIDSRVLSKNLPKHYKGMKVILNDFGDVKMEIYNRGGPFGFKDK